MARPARVLLIRSARLLDQRYPAVADWLRDVARPIDPEIAERREVLRLIWERHFPDQKRTPVARQIASAWQQVDFDREPMPGTVEALFHRLHRQDIGPRQWRTIAADLDEMMH